MRSEYTKQRLAEIAASNPDAIRTTPTQRDKANLRMLRELSTSGHDALAYHWTHEKVRAVRILDRKSKAKPIDKSLWVAPENVLKPLVLSELPEVTKGARRPGVYFLFFESELEYIGSSINVWTRCLNHDLYKSVIFDSARYLPVDWPWHLALEAHYINEMKPRTNSSHLNGPPVCT